jgi:hypothetical protein
MKPTVLIGVLLLVAGVVALAYQGFSYTTKEKVIQVGRVQVSAETRKTVPLPPVLGGSAIAVGLALILAGVRRT